MLFEASCSSGKAVQPDKTRRVLQPVFWPNSMSVSSLSPTIHILDVSRLKLQQLKTAMILSVTITCF
uniref:Uncharacterized protein n=1 Tax=Arundo donax TaxID=35708 RepID=A0A0A9BT42_ARUDO